MAQTWKTVRIFISSTFRDMHAERDYLVKVVFPELRERMAQRHLHLVDVDLRWGVTEAEAEQGKLLDIILDEIDRSRPFFIAMLGERYGSIPDKVPEDTRFAYPWLSDYHNHSLTALEIIHGVLRNPDLAARSFFYFRDPKFISQVPEGRLADFAEKENTEAALKLAALKNKIRASGRPVMENYPCRWDDAKQSVADLDAFGQQVLEDLWTAICAEYPEKAPEADPLAIERQMHEAFVEERSRLHIGRKEQAARLTEYVHGTDRRTAVITGESGCGKSAFLASWYRKYASENPDDFVLAYFIGATPDSTNHYRLLRNMCEELKRKFALKEEISQEDKKLPETLALLLFAASRDKTYIVILLDALDQLSPLEGAHGLSWLLDYMPEKARLVVSSLEGDCLEVLRRREAEEILLPPLTENEQRQIVQTVLSEWRRRLDDKQMAALLAHPGVKNPLYLRVALEELRLFGIFELLTKQIETLKHDIPGLFDQVLARLEKDHGRELVAETFALLGCSRFGLSEKEMLELLRREGEEQLPRALWARLARSAKAYLVQRGEFIGFFHRQLADAAAARYLNRENEHAKLATYFQHTSLERKLDEYPYQLYYAEQWQALAAALSDLDFFGYAWKNNSKREWMAYWRSLQGRFEPGTCYQAAIEAREKIEGETAEVARLMHFIGWFLDDMALYSYANFFNKRALAIREKALGPNHPDVADSLNNLGLSYEEQGRYVEAEPLHKRALAIREKALGPNHPDVATSLNNLGLLYEKQGRYVEAEPLCKLALAISEKALPSDNPYVAISLNNLAALYEEQGKYAEAEPLHKRALTILEKALGPNHPNVADSLNNLGLLYEKQGRYIEAEPLHKRALTIREKALGPNHPHVTTSLNNLAQLYRMQGRYIEAEPPYKRALTIREKALGHDHPEVATLMSNIGLLYEEQGKYAEAEPLHKQALAIREKALGPNHPDVATSLNNLGLLYEKQGRYIEAEPLHKRALAIREKALGHDHPEVATSLNNLARIYYSQGRYAEAEPLCKRALAISEKALPSVHPDVASSLNNLAALYYAQSKYAEAEPLYKRALTILEKALGHDHREVATSLNNLANLYWSQGRYAEVEPLHKRALTILEKALGHDHPEVATSLNNLANLYCSQGRYAEAEPLCKRALTILEKALGPNHPGMADSLSNLAYFYYSQGRYAEAEPLLKSAVRIAEAALGHEHPNTGIFRAGLLVCQAAPFVWGLVLIVVGIINVLWGYMMQGAILGVTGLLALLIRRHGVFLLSGIVLSLFSIQNILGEAFGGRTVFSVLQLLVGMYMIRKSWNFWRYALRKG